MTGLMLAFSGRDALPGMGAAPFPVAGNGLAAIAAAIMYLCRRASVRYAVGVAMLSLMLAAPVATFFFFGRPHIKSRKSAGNRGPYLVNGRTPTVAPLFRYNPPPPRSGSR